MLRLPASCKRPPEKPLQLVSQRASPCFSERWGLLNRWPGSSGWPEAQTPPIHPLTLSHLRCTGSGSVMKQASARAVPHSHSEITKPVVRRQLSTTSLVHLHRRAGSHVYHILRATLTCTPTKRSSWIKEHCSKRKEKGRSQDTHSSESLPPSRH